MGLMMIVEAVFCVRMLPITSKKAKKKNVWLYTRHPHWTVRVVVVEEVACCVIAFLDKQTYRAHLFFRLFLFVFRMFPRKESGRDARGRGCLLEAQGDKQEGGRLWRDGCDL